MPGMGELMTIFVICLMMPLTGLWIWTLVDCVEREPLKGNDRLIWMLVILLDSWIGALVYLFVRRPQRKKLLGR